jgi:hypothetical protein
MGRSHNREKRLTASSCQSVRMYQRGSYGTNFRVIWHRELELESVEKLPIGLKSDNIGHFTCRPKSALSLPFTSTRNKNVVQRLIFILLTVTCTSTVHRRHCCIFVLVTVVTRTRRKFTLYILRLHCLSCLKCRGLYFVPLAVDKQASNPHYHHVWTLRKNVLTDVLWSFGLYLLLDPQTK